MAHRAKAWELLCAAGLEAGLSVTDWARRGQALARDVPLVHHQAYSMLIRGHLARSEAHPAAAARSYLDAADRFLSVNMSVEQSRALGLAAAALTEAGREVEGSDAAKLAVEVATRSDASTLLHWLGRTMTATRAAVPDTGEPKVEDTPALDELTNREREVAQLICSGMKRKEIAKRLRISTRTVDVHLTRIYRKTGVHSNTQLALTLTGGLRDGD
ncbi:hypothetical protein GCM10029964_052580 [Kibdelosporangium lantanae]